MLYIQTKKTALLFVFRLMLWMSVCSSLNAQKNTFHFENITKANGLSDNNINCFYQDNKGFLWIGTQFGLNRFDGKNIKTFYSNPGDINSISGNNVIDILQDETGIFWIATKDGGLTRYDPSQPIRKQFKRFTHNISDKNSLPTNRLTCLYNYNKDYILAGAEVYPGVFINKHTFQTSLWKMQDVLKPEANKPDNLFFQNWTHRIKQYGNNGILISFLTPAQVTLVRNDSLIAYKSNIPFLLSVPNFCVDGNIIWCCSWRKGLYKQRIIENDLTARDHTDVQRFSSINDYVTGVELFADNNLLVSTASSGIFLVDKTTASIQQIGKDEFDENGLLSNRVNCIYRDNNDIWWIGTNRGISKYNPNGWPIQVSTITGKNHINAYSIDINDAGTIRICTSDGIYKKTKSDKEFKLITFSFDEKSVEPTFIYKYHKNRYILGTEVSLFEYFPEREVIKPLPQSVTVTGENGWAHNNPNGNNLYKYDIYQVRSAVFDTTGHQNILWFGALGWGLGYYNFNQKKHDVLLNYDSIPSSIKNNLASKVVLDKNNDLWVGTAEGLYKLNRYLQIKNDFRAYFPNPDDPNTISNGDITDIFVDETNHLWLTTNGGGLNEFDGSKFLHYYASTVGSNLMYGIYPDRNNYFWIPSAKGFEIFDRSKKVFYHFDPPNDNWVVKPPAKMYMHRDGSLMYAVQNKLITIPTPAARFDTTFPKIILSDFQVNDQSLGMVIPDSFLSFSYKQNFINFYFSAMRFNSPGTVNYAYRLEGLGEEWNYTADDNAQYTSLPPGSYTFEMRVTNSANQWSKPTALISFTIGKPFWKGGWFLTLCVAAGLLIVYIIIRIRTRQIMKIQAMRNRIANDLHDDVGSALSTISLYTEVAKLKVDSENGLKDMLEKISVTSQEMQENMHHIVWSIQPRNDRFDQILLHLKQYAFEILQPKQIEFAFHLTEQLHLQKLSPEQRKEIFLIFKEAMNNIIKYAQCKKVVINFEKNEKNITMTITDNGKGFITKEYNNGNGLASMQQRAESLKGKLHIQSSPGSGTRIDLVFPLR